MKASMAQISKLLTTADECSVSVSQFYLFKNAYIKLVQMSWHSLCCSYTGCPGTKGTEIYFLLQFQYIGFR